MMEDCQILVVDDNAMNLKLTVSLLKGYGLHADTADSGKVALEKVQEKKYHLIFMDYRMPQMDGVETTQKLRELEGSDCREVPVIALTGDDREDVRDIFYEAGMNDILLKPIEKAQLETILEKWLPREKRYAKEEMAAEGNQDAYAVLKEVGIDAAEGIKNCGGKELFETLLSDFYHLIDLKSVVLVKSLAEKKLKEYTIEVHALKNCARLVGAIELSKDFADLENLGNSGNMEEVKKGTPKVLKTLRQYKEILAPFEKLESTQKEQVSKDTIIECLRSMEEAVEAFDIDSVDAALKCINTYELPDSCRKPLELLNAYVADVALEKILAMIKELIQNLENTY